MKLKSILLATAAIIGLTASAIAQNVPDYVPKNGLVGWWPFNGNANDESGNGNNGVVNGATLTSDRFGSVGKAYSFYGTNDYIEISTTSGIFDNPSFSISFWRNSNQSPSNPLGGPNVHPAFISRLNSGGPVASSPAWNDNFVIYEAGGQFTMQSSNGQKDYGFNGAGFFSINAWDYFVLTFSPTQGYKVFKNGSLSYSQSAASSGQISYDPYPIRLGRSKFTYWKDFSGILDDIAIYNRALTQQEITNLYNAGILGIHIGNVTGLCNQTVDVPVKVSSFRNILTMQGSINWNSADLRFESISSFGPASAGLSASNFGLSKTNTGKLSFSWNDGSDQGVTLPDSTILFTMRFTPLGTTIRSVPISFSADPLPLEFYDREFNQKQVQTTNGNVQVNCEININGKVLTPLGHGVRTASVVLNGGTSPQTVKTDSSGSYQFKVLPGSYVLTPSKNYEQFKTNGISTLDLALIQAHILQRVSFNSPYKVIAADVNSSSSVTTVDILHLRRLILGIDTSLPNNRIWAFVDGDHVFANPLQPFPYPSTKSLVNQDRDVTHTFRGIKLGDVNYDRNPMLDQAPSGDTLRLYYETEDQHDGTVTVRIKAKAIQNLMGAQATLAWDPSKLTLLSATPGLSNLGTGDKWKQDGYLTLSWNDQRAEGVSFTTGFEWLVLTMQKKGIFNQTSLWLSEEKLQSEAFNQSFQSVGLSMERNPIAGIVPVSFKVYPNPADRYIDIEWTSERKETVHIRLLDVSGRMLFEQNRSVDAGVQKLRIERDQRMGSSAILVLEMEQGGVIQRKKIMTVKQNP